MESKIQNSILIGDENETNQNENNEDIFEAIFNEIKENFKSVDEEEIKNEKLNETKEKEEKEEEKKEEKGKKNKSEEINGFVVVKIPEDNKEELKRKNSDEDDF